MGENQILPESRPSRLVRVGWLLGLVAGFFVLSILNGYVGRWLHLSTLVTASLGQALILVLVLAFIFLDGQGLKGFGLREPWAGTEVAAVPGVILIHYAGSIVTSVALTALRLIDLKGKAVLSLTQDFGHLSPNMLLLVSLGLALQAGIGEELLFRGYLITRLEKLGLGAAGCILISAAAFGLVHWPGYGFWLALSKGIWFGIPTGAFFYYRRKLTPLIAAHALMDFMSFVLMFFIVKANLPM